MATYPRTLAQAATTDLSGTYAPIGQGVKSAAGIGTKALTKANGAKARLKVLALGDSVANFKWRFAYAQLKAAWGGGDPGGSIGAGAFSTGWSIPGITVIGTTGTVTGGTTDFDAWWSGVTEQFSTGATRTYGAVGTTAWWDTAKVYYVQGPSSPDGGTFKIQLDDVDEAGFTNVSTSNASVTLGIATITKGSVAQRVLKVVNLTGAHRIIGVAFERSDVGGVIATPPSRRAVSICPRLERQQRWPTSPYTSPTTPRTSSPGDEGRPRLQRQHHVRPAHQRADDHLSGRGPPGNVRRHRLHPDQCKRRHCAGPEQRGPEGRVSGPAVLGGLLGRLHPGGPIRRMVALGWEGDGTHVADECNAFLTGLMLRDLGLLNHSGLGISSVAEVTGATLRALSRIDIGANRSDGAAVRTGAFQQADPDVQLLLRRQLLVVPTTGTTDAWSWVMRPRQRRRPADPVRCAHR